MIGYVLTDENRRLQKLALFVRTELSAIIPVCYAANARLQTDFQFS